jgi:glycosyltransferase involved in cell wall biosynthesis
VQWDVPLLEGYRWHLLPNLRREDRVAGFWSLINPSVLLALRRGRYDAVWVHGHGYATHVLVILLGRVLGVPVLMRSETHLLLSRSRTRRALRGVLMRFVYRTLCAACMPIGTLNRQFYLAHGVPAERLALVPYTVDNEFFEQRAREATDTARELRSRLGIGAEATLILWASKLTERKRPMDLLVAYRELRSTDDNAALVIAGTGEEEERMRAYVEARRVPDVHFLGFQNQSELPALYRAADVFVLCSQDEPWGLVINEAMCAGLPIVCTREIGAAADLVFHGDNGLLYEAGDLRALEAHLRVVCADSALRCRMAERSREIIAGWDLDRSVEGVRQALQIVLGPRPANRSASVVALPGPERRD